MGEKDSHRDTERVIKRMVFKANLNSSSLYDLCFAFDVGIPLPPTPTATPTHTLQRK